MRHGATLAMKLALMVALAPGLAALAGCTALRMPQGPADGGDTGPLGGDVDLGPAGDATDGPTGTDRPAADRPVDLPDVFSPDGGDAGDAGPPLHQEMEPNDTTPTPIQTGEIWAGTLDREGDTDLYGFQASAGDLVYVTLSHLGSGFSGGGDGTAAAVAVIDRYGDATGVDQRLLLQQAGATTATRQVFIRRSGMYTLRVASAGGVDSLFPVAQPRGGSDFTYQLQIQLAVITPSTASSLPLTASPGISDGSLPVYQVQVSPPSYLTARLDTAASNFEPILSIWDPSTTIEVATSPTVNPVGRASVVATGVGNQLPLWVVLDHYVIRGGVPSYEMTLDAVQAGEEASCGTAPDVATGQPVVAGDTTRTQLVGWMATGDATAVTATCTARSGVQYGPRVHYVVSVPAGNVMAARLFPEFDGALILSSVCDDPGGTCVGGADASVLGQETLSHLNLTSGSRTFYLTVSTAAPAGGYYDLVVDTNAGCLVTRDCGGNGDYCRYFRCADPSGGLGQRFPASFMNGPVAIPDAAQFQACPSTQGGTADTKFLVQGIGTASQIKVHVYVDITHPHPADLKIELIGTDGATTAVLQAPDPYAGSQPADVVTVFPDETPTPASLDGVFDALPADGPWSLRVTDTCNGNTGTLNAAVLIIEAQ